MKIQDFEQVVFFSGAGLSAESGIPTYRGRGGIWAEYNYEDFACQRAFDVDPERVWDFHDKRRAYVAERGPNAGHKLIAEFQKKSGTTSIITQNIDGLHQRAGATDVIELHGSLWRVRCDREGIVRPDATVPFEPRRCTCGEYWRPDIVWFEDQLSSKTLDRTDRILRACSLIISIGTSGLVYPAAALPLVAKAAGAVSVEINLDDTAVSTSFDVCMRGPASECLAHILSGAPF